MTKLQLSFLLFGILFAPAAFAGSSHGPVIINTPGFAMLFPGRWDVLWNDDKTEIITGVDGKILPMIIVQSAFLSAKPTAAEMQHFQQYQKKNTLDAVQNMPRLRGFFARAKWRSERKTLKGENGASIDKQDVESEIDEPQKQSVCAFLRNYHSPHAEVYFAQIEPGTCAETRHLFDDVATRIRWK